MISKRTTKEGSGRKTSTHLRTYALTNTNSLTHAHAHAHTNTHAQSTEHEHAHRQTDAHAHAQTQTQERADQNTCMVGLAANAAVIESPNAITMETCAGCTAEILSNGSAGIPDGIVQGNSAPVAAPRANIDNIDNITTTNGPRFIWFAICMGWGGGTRMSVSFGHGIK